MPIINLRIRFIEKFLAHFNSVFSTTHQRSVLREFIGSSFLLSKNKDITAHLYSFKSERFKKKLEN